MIFPHSSSLFTSSSFVSSTSLFCSVALLFLLYSSDLSSSYYSSSSSSSPSLLLALLSFLRFVTGEAGFGFGSTSPSISFSFFTVFFSFFRISTFTILNISSRKEVVLQKSQNQWQNLSLKFQQELGLAIFFSPLIIVVFSDKISDLRESTFQKAQRRGIQSQRIKRTTLCIFSTSSISCWFTKQSLAQICSILALLSRQNLLQMAQKSVYPSMQPSVLCLFWMVLRSFSTTVHLKWAMYSSRNPATKSKLISLKIWIYSSVSFWNSSSVLLNLLISLMQQWSIFWVKSLGTSMSSLLRNSSMISYIFRSGNLKIYSQVRGGNRWKPVGFSLSFLRYIMASLMRQYQQIWLEKKMPSRSSCMLRPLNPLNPQIRQNIENLLCLPFSSLRLQRKFFTNICAIFLQPVRMMNHSNRNCSKDFRLNLWRMISQSQSILSMERMLIRLPVISKLNEKGVTTFQRKRLMPEAEFVPILSDPLLLLIRKTCEPISLFMGMFFFQSEICSFSLAVSSRRWSASSLNFAASSSSLAMVLSFLLCFSS